jgi:NAD(P)-dependent dehydrogenase (short-subunit alcohol dehydrogenase family)
MSATSTSPILLILGSGPRIGKTVASTFAAKGYKIALAARSVDEEASTSNKLNIKADLSDPSCIPAVFAKVKETLGPPTVIVYNGKYILQLLSFLASNIYIRYLQNSQ